ncbi:hypothetical protein ACF0H5_022891 [Mactra antiquata]
MDGGGIQNSLNLDNKLILVNAYMRSGSTFLGRLLGHQEKIFYFYEPLHRMISWNYLNGTNVCKYTEPVCTERPGVRDEALDYLEDLFNCKMRPHENKFNESLHTEERLAGSKWNKFRNCRKSSTIQSCLELMENDCRKCNYRSMKVLRMSLNDSVLLLDRLPNLKMIHVFRDPRAIINSHIYTPWFKHTNNSENDIRTNCHRIENDVIAALKLTKLYPEKLMVVQYEDLYGNFQKFEKVYSFIGMTVTPGVERFLHQESSKKGPDSRFKYRKTLSFNTVKVIDKHCAKALELLGLRTYSSASQLKDFNVNPVINKLPFTIE